MLLSIALGLSAGVLKAIDAGITLTTDNKTSKDITAKIYHKVTDSTGNVTTKKEVFTIAAKSKDKNRSISYPKITKITFEDDSTLFAKDGSDNDIITSKDINAAAKKEFTVKLESLKRHGETATVTSK